MRVLAAAGGTGGHLYPALAVVEELQHASPEVAAHFAVSGRGLELRVLAREGHAATRLLVEGFHRREVLRNLLFPFRAVAGFLQSLVLVIRFKPSVAFGTGGFVTGPALLAAWLLRVPIALIALDTTPGVTVRMLAPLAGLIFITHPKAGSTLGEGDRIRLVGTPIRMGEAVNREAARDALGVPRDARLLFVTGGSQGSALLNRTVGEALPDLLAVKDLHLLWQCGSGHEEDARRAATAAGAGFEDRIHVRPYIDDMQNAWAATDLVLCRAGASTIAELTLHGVPAILVPLATSAGGHQEANARAMLTAGAARMILEEDLDASGLQEVVTGLFEDPETFLEMAGRAGQLQHAGAARGVALGLVEIAKGIGDDERRTLRAALGESV